MKKLIQNLFLLDQSTTWNEMFVLAVLATAGLLVFWVLLFFTILLWG